jgi:hypothetical protein
MSQKSSLMKTPQCVPRALTSDNLEFGWEVDVEIKPQQLTEDMSAIFQGKPGK